MHNNPETILAIFIVDWDVALALATALLFNVWIFEARNGVGFWTGGRMADAR